MATRSTITFFDEDEENLPLITVYQHFDGYLKGVGLDIAKWLLPMKNSITKRPLSEKVFNGMGCLAAQFIAEFKKEWGNLYIAPLNQQEEFNYKITLVDNQLYITVTEGNFKGTPQQFIEKYG